MNCNRCEELMSDYLENALGQSERDAIELHFKDCADCKQLLAGMAQVLEWGKTFPVHEASAQLQMRIIESVPARPFALEECAHYEPLLSDYLEDALSATDRSRIDAHLQSCMACSGLLANMGRVVEWGRAFPVHEPPAWLPARIIANTPRVEREKWSDTIAVVWRWIFDPRAAMGFFTATLVLSWLGNIAGISPNWSTVVRNPTAIYYEAQGAVNRAYDEAVRRYYRSPLVSEIRTRIEQLREIS